MQCCVLLHVATNLTNLFCKKLRERSTPQRHIKNLARLIWNCLKNSWRLWFVSYIRKKLHVRCWVLNTPLHLLRSKYFIIERDEKKICASIFHAIAERVPLAISSRQYFLRISKVGICYITGQGDKFRVKNATFTYTFVAFFCCFSWRKVRFLSFLFLFLIKYQISTTNY